MRQEEQELEKERVSLGQREGSVEAGKSEEREGHNKRRKMCVFAYCSGPTYPAILLRRQSPEEEEEEEDSGIPSLGQQHTHTSSLCSSHTHTAP